ncbi:precorrin-6y C5,15-methyltransferase (decarboxylating) subunit CbiE [Marinovum sp. 2_MG-2023]|uniref:precorrin-6y C5,15-methyltransferase (decarboxylating) subunit CbiE n=1 Tax=unclassified Marinovum TaxID=2647166 RepID=UPI0026E4477F|nr:MULTISPECIES: precorrin-6y C5,15-methyltransferase (decarboxylating) subunit CbiE [unclassified Marinovum]MDO6732103.1 precorrin-6y C5,15-methyltransferase (decarboxylating) subunit CbiE [Marinovum sp. 2_MG-2023]MDO6781418.1 precorrin-6y C5,15-methyltransferase (decarboxylating) subunit CbiE [Marinovum sp. 1_MG-2023]
MSDPWLNVIGLGEDGLCGLSDASRDAIAQAQVIFGGPRHLDLVQAGTRGRPWPVPFDLAPVLALRGQPVVVLASGDPFWFGAGSMLAQRLAPDEWRAHPVAGVVSLACARLGWRVEETRALALHAAEFTALSTVLHRSAKILATLRDEAAPDALAQWLTAAGFGAVRMHVLERLGGPKERHRQTRADDFQLDGIAAPVAVALDGADLVRGIGLSGVPGRGEHLFHHDGQITKSPQRALTLAALAPRPGEMLWDIGGGSGSVSVEWALAGGHALTIEPRAERCANIRANIATFALSRQITLLQGRAPEVLSHDLPTPDAIFVGGGGSADLFAALWGYLMPGARLVVNAVTLETETLLLAMQAQHGGTLTRIDIAQAAPLGRLRGWVNARPLVQWAVTR